jgi:protein-ribulosamine 3-kinase
MKATTRVDPAVLRLLQLDADSTYVSSAGGGGCSSASTSKIVSKPNNGEERLFFMKMGTGSSAEIMFEGPPLTINSTKNDWLTCTQR